MELQQRSQLLGAVDLLDGFRGWVRASGLLGGLIKRIPDSLPHFGGQTRLSREI